MEAAALRGVLERHKRVLKTPLVHLLGDQQRLVVGSSLVTNHVLRSPLPGVRHPLNVSVSLEVLLGIIPSKGDVELVPADGELRVRCGKSKGAVSTSQEEPPVVPRERSRSGLEADDVTWLRDVLPLVGLGKMETAGTSALSTANGVLCACTFDDVHGAFAWVASRSHVNVGLRPEDAVLLGTFLGTGDVTIGPSDDNRLVVRTGGEALAIPCVPPLVQSKQEILGDAQPCWRCLGGDLQEVIAAAGVVAKAKEAGPIRISCERDGLRVSALGPTGSVERDVPARVRQPHGPVALSSTYLLDVVGRIGKDEAVTGLVEPREPSTRIVLQTPRITYVIVSGD